MREILFKAKRADNGEWIVGSLIQAPYIGSMRSWISSEQEDKARLREISSNQAVWRAFEVRTDTICQYTGLKDKNGKLIWENDIVEIGEHECMVNGLYKVIYCEINFCYALERSVDFHYNFFTFSALNGFETSSNVIGNIFDNHELLNE